jgi:hypothetical protein
VKLALSLSFFTTLHFSTTRTRGVRLARVDPFSGDTHKK